MITLLFRKVTITVIAVIGEGLTPHLACRDLEAHPMPQTSLVEVLANHQRSRVNLPSRLIRLVDGWKANTR